MGYLYCCVTNCRRSNKDKQARFFRIPAVITNRGVQNARVTTRRRSEWLHRLNLLDKNITGKFRVCDAHFVKGKPSIDTDEIHPDWAPSQNLEKVYYNAITAMARHERRINLNVQRAWQNMPSHPSNQRLLNVEDTNPGEEECCTIENKTVDQTGEDAGDCILDNKSMGETRIEHVEAGIVELAERSEDNMRVDQHDVLDDIVMGSKADQLIRDLISEIEKLKLELKTVRTERDHYKAQSGALSEELKTIKSEFNEVLFGKQKSDFFERCQSNDALIKTYTSLNSSAMFEALFQALEPAVKTNPKQALSLREQLFLTLVKLAHDLTEDDLAFRFRIGQSTVSRYFQKWINIIDQRLSRRMIHWPSRDTLLLTMPMCFRTNFRNATCVVDCFEVQMQIPHVPTTPQGSISLISVGYVGRTSDKHIVQSCGFVRNLIPGDLVLADKGFPIAEDVALSGATLSTPAYVRNQSQMTLRDTEYSRQVSNVRIHIERIIGSLRMRFRILTGPVNISFLRCHQPNVSFYDQIVRVCCILSNMNPSVVPLE